jgi:hypothetical protein
MRETGESWSFKDTEGCTELFESIAILRWFLRPFDQFNSRQGDVWGGPKSYIDTELLDAWLSIWTKLYNINLLCSAVESWLFGRITVALFSRAAGVGGSTVSPISCKRAHSWHASFAAPKSPTLVDDCLFSGVWWLDTENLPHFWQADFIISTWSSPPKSPIYS